MSQTIGTKRPFQRRWSSVSFAAKTTHESIRKIYLALSTVDIARIFYAGFLHFWRVDDGQLCRLGSRLPQGFLPQGPWESLLSLWMLVELPPSSLPAQIVNRIPLKLVRNSQHRDANLLLTSMEQWLTYGSTAPQIRLDRWDFAVSLDREVLIRGVPLAPIPGKYFALAGGIAVPCGWHWSPAVDVDVLARTFCLAEGDLILWRDDGRIEQIAEHQFVRATRSAIRLSAEAALNV